MTIDPHKPFTFWCEHHNGQLTFVGNSPFDNSLTGDTNHWEFDYSAFSCETWSDEGMTEEELDRESDLCIDSWTCKNVPEAK